MENLFSKQDCVLFVTVTQLYLLTNSSLESFTRGRRVVGSSPGVAEDPPCRDGLILAKSVELKVLPLAFCGSLERKCHLRCHPCHLIEVRHW
ncbi:hypothetical protein TNCV_3314671 [Trichonephila clavipes]|nr:hypothetical protein TNCV_3314671 [Trichonephila clavipes]